ncbi:MULTISPECIES: peptide ABC transporter substrate-binding protein [unclassified Clostridioides]|uniref:peptide ABC transporter substrate-binding protein n=1 Tax=unclassified Clostridioides TaxID=2635829 RepID=UPI0007BB8586|nr:peptide ABC transporter substrate-binding protein [Clostridioides sp. ZZV14-6387]MCI9976594.1 peptide ABC transporter substrate-binding protein [Clostridioides difficile]MDB3085745.1 peptide ABC transporter substrate-binding protein [Clostridioides difficile]MDI0264432.1 peptide ABC transporter substrate-binding protein [Clostridioides difficile]MDI7815979.1 peptide ABC transporter substrate-binding protein [Clostridioides difficile]
MINYMVDIVYSEKISEVEKTLKSENIQYEFTSRDGFIFFGFYEMTDTYRFETLCSDEKIQFKRI